MNITENLNWHVHIRAVCVGLSYGYYVTESLKDDVSFHMIYTIYYAYFQS
jgi:hypothetical protein